MKNLEFGDMIFYAITSLVLILLFWLRFVESNIGLWGAWVIWAVWAGFLVYNHLKARRRNKMNN